MADLNEMTGIEAIAWLLRDFATGLDPRSAGSSVDARDIALYLDHGITETEVIADRLHADAQRAAARSGSRPSAESIDISPTEGLRALPAGYRVNIEDLEALGLVGGVVWAQDPEGREDWLTVAREALAHEAHMLSQDYEVQRKRRTPQGGARVTITPRETVTAIHSAGRGPTYAREIIKRAIEHTCEIDAFGFGDEITPGVYADMASAGIKHTSDLQAYLAAGLDVAEAIRFRSDGIAPAAVLMAKAEGHPIETWHDLLLGLPDTWFRPLGDAHYSRPDDGTESYAAVLTHYLRTGGTDRYRIADLRYLVEHGWDENSMLGVRGLRELTYYRAADITDANRYQPARLARLLADHGIDWRDVEKWAEALTVGKAPQYATDTRRPPLLGWGKGRGPAAIDVAALDGKGLTGAATERIGAGVLGLVDAGLKPSHMAAYRKAGCTSIAEVLAARAAGITPKVAERLCQAYGRQPDPRHHKATWVIDSFEALMRAWRHDRADATAAS